MRKIHRLAIAPIFAATLALPGILMVTTPAASTVTASDDGSSIYGGSNTSVDAYAEYAKIHRLGRNNGLSVF